MPVTCFSLRRSRLDQCKPCSVRAAVQMNQLAISVTTQSLESCFSPLLDTKGYHGFPELQAQGSKVLPNCSIDGRRGDSTALNLSHNHSGCSVVFIGRCCCLTLVVIMSTVVCQRGTYPYSCIYSIHLTNTLQSVKNSCDAACSYFTDKPHKERVVV